jgi:glycosyltransferase involved in cell wall biosynthesis
VTGWLAPPGDAEAWAGALRLAIDVGPGRRHEMGLTAANRVRQLYSVDAMCAATLAAYERVLEAHG